VILTLEAYGLVVRGSKVAYGGEDKLRDFEEHEGNIILCVTVTPSQVSIQNLVFHFRQGQVGCFCENLLQAIYTEHFAMAIEALGFARCGVGVLTALSGRIITVSGLFEAALLRGPKYSVLLHPCDQGGAFHSQPRCGTIRSADQPSGGF
jgi:hypothetical protein